MEEPPKRLKSGVIRDDLHRATTLLKLDESEDALNAIMDWHKTHRFIPNQGLQDFPMFSPEGDIVSMAFLTYEHDLALQVQGHYLRVRHFLNNHGFWQGEWKGAKGEDWENRIDAVMHAYRRYIDAIKRRLSVMEEFSVRGRQHGAGG